MRLSLALVALVAGCSLLPSARRAPEGASPERASVVLSNETDAQAELWVVAPDVNTRRVGAVMAGETATLRVPDDFYSKGVVSFYTRLRGTPASPGIYDLPVRPNEQLRLRLPRNRDRLALVRDEQRASIDKTE